MDKFIELIKNSVNMTDLQNALTVTWQGMAAIFIVMAVISALVFCFTKFPSKKNKQ